MAPSQILFEKYNDYIDLVLFSQCNNLSQKWVAFVL